MFTFEDDLETPAHAECSSMLADSVDCADTHTAGAAPTTLVSIRYQHHFKVQVLTFKAPCGLRPSYLWEHNLTICALKSIVLNGSECIACPWCLASTFFCQAPTWWTVVPSEIRAYMTSYVSAGTIRWSYLTRPFVDLVDIRPFGHNPYGPATICIPICIFPNLSLDFIMICFNPFNSIIYFSYQLCNCLNYYQIQPWSYSQGGQNTDQN